MTSAVIVDPGLATAFKADSLKTIQAKTTIINLGSPGDVPVAVYAQSSPPTSPRRSITRSPAPTISASCPCARLARRNFCRRRVMSIRSATERGLRDRAEVHQDVEQLIVEAFEKTLK